MQLASPTLEGHLSRLQTQHLLLLGCGGWLKFSCSSLQGPAWGISGEVTEAGEPRLLPVLAFLVAASLRAAATVLGSPCVATCPLLLCNPAPPEHLHSSSGERGGKFPFIRRIPWKAWCEKVRSVSVQYSTELPHPAAPWRLLWGKGIKLITPRWDKPRRFFSPPIPYSASCRF